FIWDIAKDVFGWIKNTGWPAIRTAFQAIGDKASWLWDKVKVAFNRLKDGVRAVKTAFEDTRDGIKSAWDKVYGYIKSPVQKAIRWLNEILIGKLNGLLGKVGVDWQIPTISTKGWARGGILPGYTPRSQGDDVLTPMRSGEGVLVSEGLRDPRSRSMF